MEVTEAQGGRKRLVRRKILAIGAKLDGRGLRLAVDIEGEIKRAIRIARLG